MTQAVLNQPTTDETRDSLSGVTFEQRDRARRILATELGFIPNEYFHDAAAEQEILPDNLSETAPSPSFAPAEMPTHLARLCEAELLTVERERELFRRMNYLKFRANSLRVTLDPDDLDVASLERIESMLSAVRATRNEIVKANMRLVISIVKKFVTPQHSFDELLSEGIMTLIGTVEKFDYDRGFRFSTYAYRSISRSVYRSISDQRTDKCHYVGDFEEVGEVEDENGRSSMDERTWESRRNILFELMGRLDRREQLIIRARYSLGAHRKTRTFQSMADKLGVSKERVRQLEQRAVSKLQAMAAEYSIDDICIQ